MNKFFRSFRYLVATCCFCVCASSALALEPCRIQIIDDENGWPVPLVQLTTTHNVKLVSDNAGVVAFDLPELLGVETWLSVEGHGYSVKKDGFGRAGVRITPQPGKELTIKVHRQLPAKRLGRITGGGLFAESQKLGEEANWKDQHILGCDSVQNVVHKGKLVWGWGDTTLASYPLGRFHMIGATTKQQPLKSFQPPIRLRYEYFAESSKPPKNLAEMPGEGPTWLDGYVSLPDKSGQSRLGATYAKIQPPLSDYERGLCVWNDRAEKFERLKVLWTKTAEQPQSTPMPFGHPVRWNDEAGDSWLLFGNPFPKLRCRATFEDWSNPQRWETLAAQDSVPRVQGGGSIKPHRGAIAWNEYRQKWVTVFGQQGGQSSAMGELWYAEADGPTGPWRDAVHIVTHNKYSFYNPQLHTQMTPAGSPVLLFEASYSQTFSQATTPTPRYDYNQVLYRLDLDEMR